MVLVDQKLGNVGQVIVEIKDGKITLSSSASEDLAALVDHFEVDHADNKLLVGIAELVKGALKAIP